MADLSNSAWSELASANVGIAPNGLKDGESPNKLAGTIREHWAAVKRWYDLANAIYTSTGTATAYVITPVKTPEEYVRGATISFFAHATNTGPATINIGGLSAKAILQHDGTPILADQIVSGRTVSIEYDGANFRLKTTTQNNPNFTGTIRGGDLALTGAATIPTGTVTTLNSTTATIGTLNATTLNGNGAGITAINASNIATGTINDARLPTTMDGKTFSSGITGTTATFTGNQIEIQGGSPRIKLTDTTAGADDWWLYADQDFYVLSDRNDDGSWDTPHPLQLRNATNDGLLYGNAFWTTGNFDPNSKANLSGATFTGNVFAPGVQTTGTMTIKGGNLYVDSDGNRHVWFRNNAGTSRGLLYHDNGSSTLNLNLYNSSGTWIRSASYRESDGRFDVNGYISTNGNVVVGNATLQTDGNLYMPWAGNYLNNVLNSKITTDGRAYPRKVGGGDLNFNWSGQGGQPTWLWGGSDGTNMYVYNPSNFSVNYASSAGNADTVDGVHSSGFWQTAQQGGSAGAGWVKFPNGLILQIGSSVVTTNGGAGGTIYFPTTFPTAVNTVVGVCGDQNVPASTIKIVSPLAGNGFSFNSPGAASQAVRVNWIAWGY